jgi:hypothetical protein
LCVELACGVVVPHVVREVATTDISMYFHLESIRNAPLHAAHLLVTLFCELALHADHGLEAGVEIWHAKLEELGQFGDELLVQEIEHLFRVVELLLRLS